MELGKSLTKELNLDDSVDTLGRWIAHYIAELIHSADNATPEERPVKMAACCDAIFKLWRHQYALPEGKRPFEDVAPIIRALESLDPEKDTPRYFRLIRSACVDSDLIEEAGQETKRWLKLVDELDYSARILISFSLAQAASGAIEEATQWAELAKAAAADETIEDIVISFINVEKDMAFSSNANEDERKSFQGRIDRLEAFINTAEEIVSIMRNRRG